MTEKQKPQRGESYRLFKSDFLEFFTHIHPLVVLIIWLPVTAFFIYDGFRDNAGRYLIVPVGFLAGLFIWTFVEYILHRFVFHFPAKNDWQKKITFLFHGIHHDYPRDKSRLVMPPVVSIPLAALFFALFYIVLDRVLLIPHWLSPVFSGFILGYILYDMLHYGTHHFPIKRGYLRSVRQHHMHHHFQTPDMRFGVSSPLWDYVFNTLPTEVRES